MKRYAILLLLVLGLSTSAWGNQIGMGYVNTSLNMGQWGSWNPCVPQFPTPAPNPCPTPCPQPQPCPSPCPNVCPLPCPDLNGGTYLRSRLKVAAFDYGRQVPCSPYWGPNR